MGCAAGMSHETVRMTSDGHVSVAQQIELACLLEATARKPGNVHPAAKFVDLHYDDFVHAAAVIAEPLAMAAEHGVGPAILSAVTATRTVCSSNVNLGICLLLAPIAAAADPGTLRQEVARLIEATTIADAAAVYAAIRLAVAGGLGTAENQDVSAAPTVTLLAAMELAESRDAIAYEWSTRFRGIDRDGASWLRHAWDEAHALKSLPRGFPSGPACTPWERAIIHTQLQYLSLGDTLIRRKCGVETEQTARQLAQEVINAGSVWTETGWEQLARLDQWLRADGHRRNPGTTADLLAAASFWCLRKNWITPPTRSSILGHAKQIANLAIPATE
jgi:triphosphoribosyl-dephospho-CoA synthase